jgi:hypothetical protein
MKRQPFIAQNERGEPRKKPASSSAQRTRVSRASPLPRSGDRSKAVMVMVIVKLLPGKIIGCRAGKLSKEIQRD